MLMYGMVELKAHGVPVKIMTHMPILDPTVYKYNNIYTMPPTCCYKVFDLQPTPVLAAPSGMMASNCHLAQAKVTVT